MNNPNDISLEDRRKRLRFRAWHRGTREADLLMGGFADHMAAAFDENAVAQFEDLLECADPDLYEWLTAKTPPPAQHNHRVFQLLRTFCNSRDH